VIVRPSIRCVPVRGDEQGIQVRNNVITDNSRGKMGANLVPGRMMLENNCFFLRAPETERSVFGGRAEGPPIAQYNREHDVEQDNLVANPRFAAFVNDDDIGKGEYFSDTMASRVHDFPDLFVTNPEIMKRGIGLDPEAFADFHFNGKEQHADPI
ncbi:MAG: hypothetical protein ABR497_07445, partial [Kiritimatiellia bacterium]